MSAHHADFLGCDARHAGEQQGEQQDRPIVGEVDGERQRPVGRWGQREGLNDGRYVYRYTPADGFVKRFACPDFTGSYLSFDGRDLYLSQWYKGQIHKLTDSGKISRTIGVGTEILRVPIAVA